MPSIEIICINQARPIDCSSFLFDIEFEDDLVSHRSPRALFQSDFDCLKGYIYHLLDGEGPTAYKLLKQNWYDKEGNSNGVEENLEFKNEYKDSVKLLLKELLISSKSGQILFTSDYQFGPQKPIRVGPMTISEFWNLHDAGNIRMNASYSIKKLTNQCSLQVALKLDIAMQKIS